MSAKHALLVDDSKSARFALRQVLQRKGFEVDMAESAEVALEMVGQTQVDAIFMDHMMPGMDGYEATAILKKDPASAHIPVVMCTSNDQEEYVQKARETGAVGILPKPPTLEKLTEILQLLEQEMALSPAGQQQAAATAPTAPTAAAVAAPAPTAAAPTSRDIDAMIRAQLPGQVREAVVPLIEQAIAEHVEGLRQQLATVQNEVTQARSNEEGVATLVERTVAEQVEGLRQQFAARQDQAAPARPSEDAIAAQIEQAITERLASLHQQLAAVQAEVTQARSNEEGVAALVERAVAEQVEGLRQQLDVLQSEVTQARSNEEAIASLVEQAVAQQVQGLREQLTAAQTAAAQADSNEQATGSQAELREDIAAAVSALRAELTGNYQVYVDDQQRESADRVRTTIDERVGVLSQELATSVREQIASVRTDLSRQAEMQPLIDQAASPQTESTADQVTEAVQEAKDAIAVAMLEQTNAQLDKKLRTVNRKVLTAAIGGGLVTGCCAMLFFFVFGG